MSDTWIEQAINETLATLNPQTLLIEAAKHVQVEGVWTKGKIRPSLIGDPCALAQVKKYRGHDPQPGMEIMAARAGRPNGGTAVNFIRGWLMEAIVVAALRASGRCEIVGTSPDLVFAHEDLEAHPDVMIKVGKKHELIQIKCPNTFSFDHYAKGRYDPLERYLPQVALEMYIGRQMGYAISKVHILLITLEPWPPSVKLTEHGIRSLVVTVDWTSDLESIVHEGVERLRETVAKAPAEWPTPFLAENYAKYPCSYCPYSRVAGMGIVACDDNEKWEKAG